MPQGPRMPSKATKIAYKILGVPANISYRRTKRDAEVNRRLIAEETIRVR